ncbi:MAG: asparagine--tRNA ligase [Clostridia bacterium]|nr:asparagine--tRNA ligase [Clostridia bacterium]
MEKLDIKKIYDNPAEFENKLVKVAGWVKSARGGKSFGFLDLNDGSCFKGVQVVFDADKISNFDDVSKLNTGSSVVAEGTLILTPEARQPFEIQASAVEVLSATDSEYPLQKKKMTLEFLREQAYLRPRTNTYSAVFRIRSECSYAIHKFMHDEGFVYVHTPILTKSDCEGGSQLFRVSTQDIYAKNANLKPEDELFGGKVFLTPTGQLEGEALAMAFGKIYTFGPTFRAENSNTTRHANEFWMMEPEIAFCDLNGLMDFEEKMIKYIIKHLLENCKPELEFCNKNIDNGLIERLELIANSEFGRITYTDAIEELKKNNDKFEFKVEWGCDIATEHERYLSEVVFEKPVFVTNYPKEIKAFYMKQDEGGKTVSAVDCLVPGIGELTGGSQRETDFDKLVNRMNELGLKQEDYWWYLNLRKFGSVEHSGFGIGFERLVMYVTGMSNIRDVELFPRTPNNCEF